MKTYKFCSKCNTKNDVNASICKACQSDLDNTIYKDRTILNLILGFVIVMLMYYIDIKLFEQTVPPFLYYSVLFLIFLIIEIFLYKINNVKMYTPASNIIHKIYRKIAFFKSTNEYTFISDLDESFMNKKMEKNKSNKLILLRDYMFIFSILLGVWLLIKNIEALNAIQTILITFGILGLILFDIIIVLIKSIKTLLLTLDPTEAKYKKCQLKFPFIFAGIFIVASFFINVFPILAELLLIFDILYGIFYLPYKKIKIYSSIGGKRNKKEFKVHKTFNLDKIIIDLLENRNYKRTNYNNETVYVHNKINYYFGKSIKKYIKYSILEENIFVESWFLFDNIEFSTAENPIPNKYKAEILRDIKFIFEDNLL